VDCTDDSTEDCVEVNDLSHMAMVQLFLPNFFESIVYEIYKNLFLQHRSITLTFGSERFFLFFLLLPLKDHFFSSLSLSLSLRRVYCKGN